MKLLGAVKGVVKAVVDIVVPPPTWPAPYAASSEQMRAAQEAAVEHAQGAGMLVLSAAAPMRDAADWWVTFGVGPLDGPEDHSFEYRRAA